MEVSFEKEKGIERKHTYNLTGLQAFTEYEVALRCAARESAFWSGWSPVRSGATEEEGKCPDPLGPSTCSGWVVGNQGAPVLEPGCLGFSSLQGLPGHRLSRAPARQPPQQLSVPTVGSLGRSPVESGVILHRLL